MQTTIRCDKITKFTIEYKYPSQSLFRYDSNGFGPLSLFVCEVGFISSVNCKYCCQHYIILMICCNNSLIEVFVASFALPWALRQFNHSDKVIFLSLFTSQYRGIFLPHFRKALEMELTVQYFYQKDYFKNNPSLHLPSCSHKFSKRFPFFSFPHFVLVFVQQYKTQCCNLFIFTRPFSCICTV